MDKHIIHIGLYEIGKDFQAVKVPYGCTVAEMLKIAGREAEKVTDVCDYGEQPVLSMDDKITKEHGDYFLGEHTFPKTT